MQTLLFKEDYTRKHPDSHFSVGEVKLKYRPSKLNCPKISNSSESAQILRKIYNPDTICLNEQFVVLYLNRGYKVIGHSILSVGGTDSTVVDQRLLFQRALLMNATAIILSHNHPSGVLKPSQADIQLTKKIVATGNVLEFTVLDHIIITAGEYLSMADEGIVKFS